MKLNNRRLKQMMRENPYPVQPKKKYEMLMQAWMQDEQQEQQKRKDGFSVKYMKKHKIGALIAAVMILLSMACAISAGIVRYYYHTPGGNIIDQERSFVEEPEGLTLKMTEKEIRGKGYTITEVNWTSVQGKSTFTVWVSADSVELKGLTATIGDKEYALKKSHVTKTEDGEPLNYGYVSLDVPEPEYYQYERSPEHSLKLTIDEPKARHYIFFVPENVEPVSDVHEDVTLTGYYYDEKLYYGVTDNVLANSEMNNLISSSFIMQGDRTLVGTDGISFVQNNTIGKNTYEVGEGSSMNYCEKIPGVTPQTYHTKAIITHHFLLPVEGKTYCELPIPEPGQTLTGEWKIFDAAGVTFTITKITRENSKTITFTTSDTQHRTFDSSEKPSEDFSDAVRSIFLCEQIFIGTEDATCSMKRHETEEGYYYRYSAKSFKEYCKTHDTIPFGIDFIEVQYSGDWTLTFPEN